MRAGAGGGGDAEPFNMAPVKPRHDGVGAAGVVADHAAQGALRVCCRVGAEGEVSLLGRGAQRIEDNTGLDASNLLLWVDFQDVAHVPGHVYDDSGVAGLPGKAGASTA